MKLTRFSVKGYRSLRDVTLDDLGDFNIFYGPNGSGKSNVLDALQTFFSVMPLAVDTACAYEEDRLTFRDAGDRAAQWITADDLYVRASTDEIQMGATIEDTTAAFDNSYFRGLPVHRIDVDLRFARARAGRPTLRLMRLIINDEPLSIPFNSSRDPEVRELLRGIVPQAFTHLGVTRTLATKASDGEVVRMLFEAKNSSDRALRDRFDRVREFIARSLHRGEFDVFMDAAKNLELREKLPEPNPLGLDIPLDHAGHGIVQAYAIITTILLASGQLVALEEPEAHLHAPTLGRELRKILQNMAAEGHVQQFFIATHSNLFDLDLTGYWDVSLVDGESVIKRKPLDEVDRLHLFEPGPAKHQLQELLRLYGDEVVFRTRDGQPLTMQNMLVSLQNDDDIAKSCPISLIVAPVARSTIRSTLSVLRPSHS